LVHDGFGEQEVQITSADAARCRKPSGAKRRETTAFVAGLLIVHLKR
jgi:hypothetical protein